MGEALAACLDHTVRSSSIKGIQCHLLASSGTYTHQCVHTHTHTNVLTHTGLHTHTCTQMYYRFLGASQRICPGLWVGET